MTKVLLRFLIHLFVELVPNHQLETMLADGWQSEFN
ncbi:hypothetical protein Xvie_02606 [Xenorhabdus vietnamensis]|uniref:Uncharacterized protein n=1 Tax=Xenorhabdus vietnamensis TaxID=351656 RepID=A0A1Y2SAW1_9GAMM|nr:hypothetical protein Xvie_02606 [Xenorhabdus vietnamensis]